MEPQQNSKKTLELIAILAIFVLLVFILIFVAKRALYPNAPAGGQTVVPANNTVQTTTTNDSTIVVKTKDGKSTYAIGEPVTLVFSASATDSIVGYDVSLPIDTNLVTIDSKMGIAPEFQFIPTVEKNMILVTGSKNLTVKTPVYLKNTPLFELVVTPKARGTITFNPMFIQFGKTNDSNLINSNTKDVLQQTVGTTIEVK